MGFLGQSSRFEVTVLIKSVTMLHFLAKERLLVGDSKHVDRN
jgi:hypothetical protein